MPVIAARHRGKPVPLRMRLSHGTARIIPAACDGSRLANRHKTTDSEEDIFDVRCRAEAFMKLTNARVVLRKRTAGGLFMRMSS